MKLAIALGVALFVSASINAVMFAKLDKAKIELQTAINNQAVLERTIQDQNEQIIKALESANTIAQGLPAMDHPVTWPDIQDCQMS